jgi:hypothetical protein
VRVLAFYACEQLVLRWSGARDVLSFGLRDVTLSRGPDGAAQGAVNLMFWLEWEPGDTGDIPCELAVVGADGERVGAGLSFVLPGQAGADPMGAVPLPLTVPQSGAYVARLSVAGKTAAEWPLRVRLAPPAEAGPE